jgi:hypothetical protein
MRANANVHSPEFPLPTMTDPVPITKRASAPVVTPVVPPTPSLAGKGVSFTGKRYGKCKMADCECDEYSKLSTTSNSLCDECGHYPASHTKIASS